MYRIESLLAARQFAAPQIVGDRICFISNLSGHMSLYAMDHGGSVPEPLLPPHIALQNPHLMDGESFFVFPELGKILVMIDQDGDENYLPKFIPIDGGFPEDPFEGFFEDYRSHLINCDIEKNIAFISAESRKDPLVMLFMVDLESLEVEKIAETAFIMVAEAKTKDYSKIIILEGYSPGDHVLYQWERGKDGLKLVYGKPFSERTEGEEVPRNAIEASHYVKDEQALFFHTTLFEDTGSLAYFSLENPAEITPMKIEGLKHIGTGEFIGAKKLAGDRYLLNYNIDGVSWLYEAQLDEQTMTMHAKYVIAGQGQIAGGVLEHHYYDQQTDRHILSYSTAISPTQIYTVEGADRDTVVQHTRERTLGIPEHLMSAGEDASYDSFDGLRVSARLYLPAEELGYQGPRPLVYWVHGGPQSQERPDFGWFSLPLIQMLTLRGFAVFVPNARGSSGYGMEYMKKVERDFGGGDRLDHVHAMTEVLPNDPRVDASRAAVVGRSYGGFMTLTLAFRHPELWSAAIDMFGPYDFFTFIERLPPTWQPYFKILIGDPEKDKDDLLRMSPRTYMQQLECPMLVIQGANDPRVVEQESRDLVEELQAAGKQVEIYVFENEGHGVEKYPNRVKVYNMIVEYFEEHLKP
ncbi:alpha/beta hydrolase family protein [Chloroflexota bacterium]